MRGMTRHPLAERHNAWMLLLFVVLTVLLTLLGARAVGGAPF